MILLKKSKLSKRGVAIVAGLILLVTQLMELPPGSAQSRERNTTRTGEKRVPTKEPDLKEHDIIERAVASICDEQARDKQGSIPIDQMAVQQALPLTERRVIDGRRRAERLLPVAKRLVPSVLSRLAASYNLEALNHNWMHARLKAVNTIKPEMEAHDNAYWRPSEPNAIILGTIFLAGIRSDEAMVTVLAHELTHALNGTDQSLQPLFARVATRASQIEKMPIQESMAAELTCEAVGVQVMREHSGRKSGKGTIRPLSRAMGKNCVRTDLADATHLSPRKTMRILLALQPELIKPFTAAEEKKRTRKSTD